jgi:hypothetical protein
MSGRENRVTLLRCHDSRASVTATGIRAPLVHLNPVRLQLVEHVEVRTDDELHLGVALELAQRPGHNKAVIGPI